VVFDSDQEIAIAAINFEYLKAEILNISKPYLVSLSHK
jgi:hypothetical protein